MAETATFPFGRPVHAEASAQTDRERTVVRSRGVPERTSRPMDPEDHLDAVEDHQRLAEAGGKRVSFDQAAKALERDPRRYR